MAGGIDFNWIGVAFVSDDLPNHQEIEKAVYEKMDSLLVTAKDDLDSWLDAHGLEQIMGVIVRKGSVQ